MDRMKYCSSIEHYHIPCKWNKNQFDTVSIMMPVQNETAYTVVNHIFIGYIGHLNERVRYRYALVHK